MSFQLNFYRTFQKVVLILLKMLSIIFLNFIFFNPQTNLKTLKIFLVVFVFQEIEKLKKINNRKSSTSWQCKTFQKKFFCVSPTVISCDFSSFFIILQKRGMQIQCRKYGGDSLSCFAEEKSAHNFFNVVFAFLNRLNVVATCNRGWRKKNIKIYGISCIRYFYKWKITFCSLHRVLIFMHTLNKFIMHFFQFVTWKK